MFLKKYRDSIEIKFINSIYQRLLSNIKDYLNLKKFCKFQDLSKIIFIFNKLYFIIILLT